ncbi:phage tail protein, partial [Streptomyces scabiei]|uniref:phage tail protein n=8 Tax=Bacillati TaxID=1783272 RepID=UPI0039EFD6B9
NINAARVEQEAMAATGKTNARELTAQEKAAAVLAIVNKDGAAAMGDFAKTADGAANTQKTLTASLEDQQSKLGQTLMPLWQDFLGFLTDTAVPALSAIVDWISQNASWLGPLSLALGLATTAVWLFNIALNANPIMLIITAIGALVGGILWVATQTTFFQDVWTNVTNAIGTAWNWLWTTVLQPVFTAIGEVFNWIYNNIIMPIVTGIMIYVGLWAAVITWLWETVISPVFAAIGQAFNWIWNSVISPVIGFISGAINNVGIIFDWLYANAVKPAFDGVAGAFNWVWNSVISPVIGFISDAINNVGNTVRDVFGGIGSFIGSAFQAALNVVRGPINGIISLVNSAIRGLNSLSVTIPSWVPIVGGQTWGLNLPTIPMLAKGGTITGAGSVLVGENGPEILNVGRGASVVPLTGSQRTPVDGGEKHFHLEQKIYATDPILGARQAAREAARYLGV